MASLTSPTPAPHAVSSTRAWPFSASTNPGTRSEPAGDQPVVERPAGAGHPRDPVGARLVHQMCSPVGNRSAKVSKTSGWVRDDECAAHVGRRFQVEQQRPHVRRQPVTVAVFLEELGRERRLAPDADVEGVQGGLRREGLRRDPVRVLCELGDQSLPQPDLDRAVADVAGQVGEQLSGLVR